MYKNTKIMMASAVAAILIVSVLAVEMPNQAFASTIVRGGNGGIGGAGGAGGVGGAGGININIGGHSWHFS